MNEIVRRFIMMVGIVAIGTILIFFDTTIYITIVAALVFGITMALGLGLLSKEDFIRLKNRKKNLSTKTESKEETEKTETPIKTEKTKKTESPKEKKPSRIGTFFSRFRKKEPENVPSVQSKKSQKGRLSAGLSAALGSFGSTIGKAQDKKHSEKIDSLLNSTIDEPLTASSGSAGKQPKSVLPDDIGDATDEMGLFDDQDFTGMDSLEIEGDDSSFNFESVLPTGSPAGANEDSGGLNLDDEINAILLAGNAFDDDDSFSADDFNDTLSPKPPISDDLGSLSEEGLFNTDAFFVQGIEDGLDEESFINLPKGLTEKHHTASLTDSLNELDSLKNFDLSTNGDDPFSDLDLIDLDELEMDGLSLESDEIIIEEEEDVNANGIFPDDYVSSQEAGMGNNEGTILSSKDSALNTPGVPEAISFSGKNEYDDILSLLQSDIKVAKKLPQKSLLRDMNDIKVTSEELEEELGTVLHLMGGKITPISTIQNRSEE